jgi:hypothetical protein
MFSAMFLRCSFIAGLAILTGLIAQAQRNTVFDVSPAGGVDRASVVAAVTDAASGILSFSGGSITIIKQSTQNVPLLIGAGSSNAWNGNAVLNVTRGPIDAG